MGADGWEMSAHVGARPSHTVYQGKQYTQEQYEQIIRPLINEYNCRHDVFPIILGISEPAYTDEELENIDPPPFTYEGKTYTAYEAQQQMRKMERVMRRQKDRCIVADAAGDKEGFTTASIKLRRQKDYYEDFCRKADCYTQYERTIVGGYDRHLSGKTGAVTRKSREFDKVQMRLEHTQKAQAENEKNSLKNTPTSINREVINSPDYKTKFTGITGDVKTDDLLYNKALDILEHRNNTYYEDMYLIDSSTSKVVGVQTHSVNEQTIDYNYSLNHAVKSHEPYSLISIHNHPESKPPSGDDFASNGARKYKAGVIVCHNGDVYIYKSGNKPFTGSLFDNTVDKYKKRGYNEIDAYTEALKQFEKDYGIEWELR